MSTECAFCGFPDHRHRVIDTIRERIDAGEDPEETCVDYGYTLVEFEELEREFETMEATQ
jgi:hypothetical protein